MAAELTLTDVARALSVSPPTLRRWVADGIVPLRDGAWTPVAPVLKDPEAIYK